MSERQWTPEQKNAIEGRGGSLLVSAAAGSGKTAVLVERVVGLLCDPENPVDVDSLLIVTFSIAAAAEMRQRIGGRLSELIAENPQNFHLRRQQALLQKAQISTIHSFCLAVIRENFQYLAVAPNFSIADESELRIMRQECAVRCIEEFYAQPQENSAFLDLVELLSTGRDDSRLVDTLFKIYDFSRAHPFPEDWLAEKAAMYRTQEPISQTPWGKTVLAYARQTLNHGYRAIAEGLAVLAEADEKLQKAYMPAFLSDHRHLEECLPLAEEGDWDTLAERLQAFPFEALKPVRGDDADKEMLKALRNRVKDSIRELGEKYFCATQQEAGADLRDLAPKIEVLFALVQSFHQKFMEEKNAKRRLDFSDLEQLTLQLLVQKDGERLRATPQAAEIARRYSYVMVDEYQDTNEAQDLIFTCVSREQQNLFMVGDVKQSIYSFRQAMPEIFLLKRERFFAYDGSSFPARLSLDVNFRSRYQVTQAVNYIFTGIMSRALGEIDYDTRESLKAGAVYPDSDAMQPELLLLGTADYSGEQDSVGLEAQAVAEKIAAMLHEGFAVSDGRGGMRVATPRDFCILMRAPKNRTATYVQALQRAGIPAQSENTAGYLQAREIAAVIALLKALDNPLLDIELVAALLSPFIGFSDDDIVRVRLTARNVPFYNALGHAAQQGDEKAAAFLALFAELRMGADTLPADSLLLRLYEKTGALELARSMPFGDARRANLLLLVEYAAQYHALGYKKLSGFVGFLSRLEERGGDLRPAGGSMSGDMVQVMSIHRSKGLEYPIVILADTGKQFNREELRAGTILHPRYGFACVYRDMHTRKQFPTIPMQAIRLEAQRSQLSEEMRILYVALTRAREKLIVVATYKGDLGKKIAALTAETTDEKLPVHLVRGANCYADWLLMALLRHVSLPGLRERAGVEHRALRDDGNPWVLALREEFGAPEESEAPDEAVVTRNLDAEIVAELTRRAAFVYPYTAHTTIPAKLAVSAVAKGKTDVSRRFAARPSFLMGAGLNAAERGNAMHKFMQFADYHRARTDLPAEVARMAEQQFLSPAEVESLSLTRLRAFFTSPLAERMFAAEKVWRELKFMAEFGKEELGDYWDGMDGETTIVLNGVADCVFVEDGAAVLVDYKTDRVQTAEELAERYRVQLALYKKILARSLGLPVRTCSLYSFALSQEIVL